MSNPVTVVPTEEFCIETGEEGRDTNGSTG